MNFYAQKKGAHPSKIKGSRLFMLSQVLKNELLCFFKQSLPRNVIQPFHTPVMLQHPRPFGKLIRTQQEIYPQYRKLQQERRHKTKGYCITPHCYGIADKTEPAVPSCAENTCNQCRIYSRTQHVVSIN